MTKNEALKMAINFMETLTIDVGIKTWNEKRRKETIQACKEALEQPARLVSYAPDKSTCTLNIDGEEVYFNREQPAQEPVAAVQEGIAKWYVDPPKNGTLLYTRPAPSWQGLSGDELDEIVDRLNVSLILDCSIADFVNAIEAKLKEKNHG